MKRAMNDGGDGRYRESRSILSPPNMAPHGIASSASAAALSARSAAIARRRSAWRWRRNVAYAIGEWRNE